MQTYEEIRDRLKGQAAERYNCHPDHLPQEPKLLVEWMAKEFSALYKQLDNSNDTIGRHIRQRLQPDNHSRPNPAFGLVCAKPKQSTYTLKPEEDQFNLSRLGPENPRQLFFAPLLPVPLLNASIKYMVHGTSVMEIGSIGQRLSSVSIQPDAVLHPGIIWIGIHSEVEMKEGNSFCFYANWHNCNKQRQKELLRLLPLVSWRHLNQKMTTKTGLLFDEELADRHVSTYIDEEFMLLYNIEHKIVQQYNDHFVQVSGNGWEKTTLPVDINDCFSDEQRHDLEKKPLYWIQLVFPAGFSADEIHCTYLQLNCFPVINRRLDCTRDFAPNTQNLIEIRALSDAGQGRAALNEMCTQFLGIQKVFTQHNDYCPVSFDYFKQANRGTYALQHGRVEAGDLRDVYGRIAELSETILEHISTLRHIDQNLLNDALLDIKVGTNKLEKAFQQIPDKDTDLGYYLHLSVLAPSDFIYIRFWITQGVYAQNAGRQGDTLIPERNNVMDGDLVFWIG
jgi:hypothetical protein